MIRVNLANRIQTAPPQSGGAISFDGGDLGDLNDGEVKKQGIIRLLMIFIGPIALFYYQQSSLPALLQEQNGRQAQLTELQEFNTKAARSVEEIKKFKEDEQRIQARISFLDGISKNRTRDIKVLELIQQIIPEKAWLTKLEMRSGTLRIQGLALSDFEVSSFMEGLSKSIFFLDVNLISSAEVAFDGMSLKDFEIACIVERRATNE